MMSVKGIRFVKPLPFEATDETVFTFVEKDTLVVFPGGKRLPYWFNTIEMKWEMMEDV